MQQDNMVPVTILTGFLGAGIGLWIERRRGLRGSGVLPH